MQEKRLSRILGIYRSNPSGSVLKVWKSYPESFYKKLVNKRFFLKIRDNPTFGITDIIRNVWPDAATLPEGTPARPLQQPVFEWKDVPAPVGD